MLTEKNKAERGQGIPGVGGLRLPIDGKASLRYLSEDLKEGVTQWGAGGGLAVTVAGEEHSRQKKQPRLRRDVSGTKKVLG